MFGDSKGSSPSGIIVTITKIDRTKVRVTSENAKRLGSLVLTQARSEISRLAQKTG